MDLLEEDEDDIKLTVNEGFARRLEHNKQREELDRLQQKHGAGQAQKRAKKAALALEDIDSKSSSSSSSEEEETEILRELQDPEFLQALAQLRQKNGSDAPASFAEAPVQVNGKKRKRERPVLLKDISPDMGTSEDTDSDEEAGLAVPAKPYAQELEGFRRELIQAAEKAEQDNERADLFEDAIPGKDAGGMSDPGQTETRQQINENLDQFFGRDEELSKEDLFLKRFVANRGEAEQSGSELPVSPLESNDLDEDERHLEAAEQFEAEHNFRYEEANSGKVRTYPRRLDGIIRQSDTSRAEARARKNQRKQEERAKAEAEIQRLKTLKRGEIEKRIHEVQSSSGLENVSQQLQDYLMSDTFDEEEYDRAMQTAFNEDYYQDGDSELSHDNDGDSLHEDVEGLEGRPAAGFKAMKQLHSAQGAETKRDTKAIQSLLEEYNKLEYEDIVAGIPTKFHYRQVDDVDYGLSTADILSLSDKDLNQLVSLKKYAPYREGSKSKRATRDTLHKLSNLKKPQVKKANMPSGPQRPAATKALTTKAERRKSTYAIPQLNETRTVATKESVREQQSDQSSTAYSAMTKAQKRNMRRSKKRKSSSNP